MPVVGEFGTLTMLVEGDSMLSPAVEITSWKSYSLTQNFLTPSDPWRAEVGNDQLSRNLLKVLIPGKRVTFLVDGAPQMSGYLTNVEINADKKSGTVVSLGGSDSFWPLTDSQINPNLHYPDKISLEQLLNDILPQFGFVTIDIDNGANVEVAINRALHSIKGGSGRHRRTRRHSTRTKALKRYKLPKKKPQHNDTFWQFLMRILNREGLWMWPTVDGKGVVVSTPEYDQEISYQLRRRFDGVGNNILRGGILRDCADQPSQIVARGDVYPTAVEHHRNRVVIDNPYLVGLGVGASLQELSGRSPAQQAEDQARGQIAPGASAIGLGIAKAEQEAKLGRRAVDAGYFPSQTFISSLERMHTDVQKWTELIPVQPITEANPFAPKTARPVYLKDEESHTLDELKRFARRQMSLHTRKAFTAKYTFMGHLLNDQIPQVDTLCGVDDEIAGFNGPLWVLSRTLNCSKESGVTTDLELLPPQSIQL
jgi:prophage tail gpP-like protein